MDRGEKRNKRKDKKKRRKLFPYRHLWIREKSSN
jgi:hypothetical protein